MPATYMEFAANCGAPCRAGAVIWDVEEAESRVLLFVHDRPLSPRVLEQIGDGGLRAAFVAHRVGTSVRRILTASVSPATVMQLQGEVVDLRLAPEY